MIREDVRTVLSRKVVRERELQAPVIGHERTLEEFSGARLSLYRFGLVARRVLTSSQQPRECFIRIFYSL